MVVITVQHFTDAEIHTLTVENTELFWVKMIALQKVLGIQDISNLVRKYIQGIYETKDFIKNKKYKN